MPKRHQPKRSEAGFNTEVRRRKRDKGMTAAIKRKSHMPGKRL
jgi:hypothetical protein